MKHGREAVILFIGLFLVWVLITWSVQPQELLTGAVLVFVVTLFMRPVYPLLEGVRPGVMPLIHMVAYVFIFIWQLILANIDVAKRVLSPSLPINPGIVKVKTNLKSPLAKMMLTSSITLTPGTLSLDVQGDEIFIHWIDVKGTDVESASKAIVAVFEQGLKGVVE
jgi:multicomponent Na+:H+ antiporter subunit E